MKSDRLEPRCRIFLVAMAALISWPAFAAIEVGSGINSFTGGRYVPSAEVSWLFDDHVLAWAGTGVQNKYYYQSSHLLFYFKSWKAGTVWGGEISAGFGAGLGYSVRGFQDLGSTTEETATDYLGGPSIRLNWSYGPVFLNFSTLYGLRHFGRHFPGLNFQDVESLTIGWRF